MQPGETVDQAPNPLLGQAMRDAAIPMLLVSPDGAIMQANDACSDYFGRDIDALPACTWQELTHPDDLSADLALVNRLLRGEADSYRLTKRYLTADGDVIVGDLSVRAIRDDTGTALLFADFVSLGLQFCNLAHDVLVGCHLHSC